MNLETAGGSGRIPHIVIYGAATKLPEDFHLGIEDRAGRRFRLLRDRATAYLGYARHLRYESYVSNRSVNMGDLSIAEAVHGLVKDVLGGLVRFSRVDWQGQLPADHIDLLLVSGGGYLFLDGQGQLPARISADLKTWQQRQIPYALVGVGINQLLSRSGREITIADQSKELVSRLLDGSCGISVRDRTTFEALAGLTKRPVALIGDPALHLAPKLPGSDDKSEALTLKPQVGINVPLHGPDSARRLRAEFPAYVNFLRRLQRQLDCDYHFVSHFETETVLPKMFAMQGIQMSLTYGPPDKLASTYRKLDLHVGGMLHSCILASSFGVPNVGLAYDRKHFGFFELMEASDRCVPAEPLPIDQLLSLASHALQNRQEIRTSLLSRQRLLHGLTMDFLSQMLRISASPKLKAHPPT